MIYNIYKLEENQRTKNGSSLSLSLHFHFHFHFTSTTRLASLAHSGCRRSATNAGKRGWGTPGQARALRALAPGEDALNGYGAPAVSTAGLYRQ